MGKRHARAAFARHTGIGAVLLIDNVDTDQIIRSRDIRCGRDGLGDKLFAAWRYLDDGPNEDPNFVLNRANCRGASILVAGDNFGCGSSREAAVWALEGFGFRAIVAKSFGSIFYSNCIANGILPVSLASDAVELLASEIERSEGPARVTVDLEDECVLTPSSTRIRFCIGALHRRMLLAGLDTIDLVRTTEIRTADQVFERADQIKRPWLYVMESK